MRLGRIYRSLSFAPSVFLLRGALRLGPGTLSPLRFARVVVLRLLFISATALLRGYYGKVITPGVNRAISGDLFPTPSVHHGTFDFRSALGPFQRTPLRRPLAAMTPSPNWLTAWYFLSSVLPSCGHQRCCRVILGLPCSSAYILHYIFMPKISRGAFFLTQAKDASLFLSSKCWGEQTTVEARALKRKRHVTARIALPPPPAFPRLPLAPRIRTY